MPVGKRLQYLQDSIGDRLPENASALIATQCSLHFACIAATLPCIRMFLRDISPNSEEAPGGKGKAKGNLSSVGPVGSIGTDRYNNADTLKRSSRGVVRTPTMTGGQSYELLSIDRAQKPGNIQYTESTTHNDIRYEPRQASECSVGLGALGSKDVMVQREIKVSREDGHGSGI